MVVEMMPETKAAQLAVSDPRWGVPKKTFVIGQLAWGYIWRRGGAGRTIPLVHSEISLMLAWLSSLADARSAWGLDWGIR